MYTYIYNIDSIDTNTNRLIERFDLFTLSIYDIAYVSLYEISTILFLTPHHFSCDGYFVIWPIECRLPVVLPHADAVGCIQVAFALSLFCHWQDTA